MERALLVAFTAAAAALWSSGASAQVGLRVEQVTDGAVRVDGSLRDWRGVRFVDVGGGSDAALRYALRYDGAGIYVGATVTDERMVRTARPTTNEDAIVLTVATPAGRGRYRAVDVWLYAGVPGAQAASAAVGPLGGRPRAASAIRVVEGPARGGYVLEAHVPFAAIPGGARWEDGRGAIRLRDVDAEARPEVESELTSATIDPRHPERLPTFEPTGGDRATLRDFLRRQGLDGTQPRHDLRGDVAGDAAPERVIVVDRYVLVLGRGASSFLYLDLPVVSAAGVRDADLVDLTGDGKREIAITMRQSNARGSRDLWQVYTVGEDAIRPMFGIELRKETSQGFVESRLAVRRARRGAALIEVTAGQAHGLDAETLRESPPADVEAMLVPWGPKLSKTWQWDGQRFAVVRERDNPEYRDPAASTPSERAAGGTSRPSGAAPAQARAPSVDDLVAAFKRQAGVAPRARPRFRAVANVAEGREDEHVMVFDSALLVVGPGFRGGTGWFHFALPVASAEDVLSVETADLTGDGRQELLFRVRRAVEDVQREILIVHQFRPTGFPRLLAVEIAREQGNARIENEVSVQRARRASVLQIAPGRARGWDAQSWPFQDGTGDGVGPILLPWRDRAARYEYRGGELTR